MQTPNSSFFYTQIPKKSLFCCVQCFFNLFSKCFNSILPHQMASRTLPCARSLFSSTASTYGSVTCFVLIFPSLPLTLRACSFCVSAFSSFVFSRSPIINTRFYFISPLEGTNPLYREKHQKLFFFAFSFLLAVVIWFSSQLLPTSTVAVSALAWLYFSHFYYFF